MIFAYIIILTDLLLLFFIELLRQDPFVKLQNSAILKYQNNKIIVILSLINNIELIL
jgi:hypothetical protein